MGYTEQNALNVWPAQDTSGSHPRAQILPAVTRGRTRVAPRTAEVVTTIRDNVRSSGQYGQVIADAGYLDVAEAGHPHGSDKQLRRTFGLARAEMKQRAKTERTRLKLAEREADTQRSITDKAKSTLDSDRARESQARILIFGGVALVILVILLRR